MWGHEGGFTVALVAREGAGETEDAVRLAGGTLVGRVDWDAAALDESARAMVLAVEARGVGDDVLAALLPVIDGLARDWAASVVVTLDTGQIDVVAAALLGPGVHLLVEPTMAMRVATLAVVGGAGEAEGGVREDDGTRARRLEAEIARIAELLMRLSGREEEEEDFSVGDRRRSYGVQGGDETSVDPAAVRGAIRARRMRDQFFGSHGSGGGLFEDPAWDMLLDLFAAELEGAQVSVSSLCIAAAVAPTTALRWIGRLTGAGLFERRADPADRRRAFIVLSEEGRGGMRGYFAALAGAGLRLG